MERGTGFRCRGNVTKEERGVGGSVVATSQRQFDIAGNVVKIVHPQVRTGASSFVAPETLIGYGDNYTSSPAGPTFAFPTSITHPGGLTTAAQYHYGLGAGGGASYVANARYYPSGAMLDWRLGPNQYEMHGHNRRGQLQDLRLGGSAQGNCVRMLPRAGSDLGVGVYGFAAWLMAPWQGVRMTEFPMLCLGLRRFDLPR